MTDPRERNETDPTVTAENDVDATVGPDDDATVFPDDDPAGESPTVVTDDAEDDDDLTVFPDEAPTEPAATVVTGEVDDDDDATVFPDEEPSGADQTVVTDGHRQSDDPDKTAIDDDLTVYGDESPPDDDDATVFPDEEPGIAGSPATVITPGQTVGPTGATGGPDDDMTVYGETGEPSGDSDQTVMGDEAASAPTHVGDSGTVAGTVGTVDSQALESVSETNVNESQTGGRTRLSFGSRRGAKTKMEKSSGGGAASARTPAVPESERYDLVDNFAHGGMGNIWKAHDQRIHRDVAYKELLPRALRRPRVVDRFVQEAQITGQLEHPGIVPIYDLGWQENGAPFYAMKLVHGEEMKDRIEEMHKLPKDSTEYRRMFVKLLGSFIDTCNALAFAHTRGVLHRDLKPQNVMLGAFGETLVLDWGLAKILGGDAERTDGSVIVSGDYNDEFDADEELAGESLASLAEATNPTRIIDGPEGESNAATQMVGTVKTDSRTAGTETKYGSVMGTPAYMPPEQAEGKLDLMDGRTDIYSLGAILYEILTNDAPIPRTKMDEMLDHVINKPITSPLEREPTTPRPLNAIAMKALSKRREDRYRSALDLAQDVEDYLADEPVSAYPEPWYDRARRWAKRHRTAVTSTAAVMIAVILGVVAWNSIESSRISGLQSSAEAKLSEARSLAAEGRFDDATLRLTEANGLVANETSLETVAAGIDAQLTAIERLVEAAERERVTTIRVKAEQDLAASADVIRSGERLNDAQAVLTEVVTRLSDEPALADLHERAKRSLAAATALIANQQERDAAQQTYSLFLSLVDRSRFFATVTTGDDLIQNATTARDAASEAFELYGGLSDDYLTDTKHLSNEQVEDVRQGSYELLLVMAESELTLVRDADDAEQVEAAGRALEALEQAESLGVKSRALLLRRARYYNTAGDDNQRDLTLLDAESVQPASALDFFLIGEERRRAGQFEQALQSYRKALQVDPEHFWSLHQMAQTHLLSGQAEAAVAGYTACIARRPDERICYLTRGIAYASLGQVEAALADLNHAQQLDPNLYAVYLNRGAVHVAAKDYEAAIADFQQAAEIRPTYAGPHVNLGEVLRIQEKHTEAEAALAKAIDLDGSNAKAHRIRALSRRAQKQHEGARSDLQQVIALDDDPLSIADAWQQIGKTWHIDGEPEQALEAYGNSITANPDNADNYRLKAEILLALNRDDEAVEAFTKFLEFGKEIGDVYRARALALAKLGRSREAMSDFTRALELEPSANMLVRRGWSFLLEANQLAAADFDAAISANPDNADAWNGRGYARVMMGQINEAIGDAEQALVRAAKQVQAEGPGAWPHIYNAATIYSQAVGRIVKDARIPEEAREANAAKLTTRAVQIIGMTLQAAGPAQRTAVIGTLQSDTALNPIRTRTEFRAAFGPKPAPEKPPEE